MMNNPIDKYINIVVNGFQQYKGKACVICNYDFIIDNTIKTVIIKFVNKRYDAIIGIIVDNYITRSRINAFLKQNGIDNNRIKINTIDFITEKEYYNYNLIITVGLDKHLDECYNLTTNNKFILNIFYNGITNDMNSFAIRNIAPTILVGDSSNEITNALVYSPVEEHRYGVALDKEDRQKYDDYVKYINNCISIFGDLATIEKCRVGDNENNISAITFRHNIAEQNGWSDGLDVTIPYLKQIDDTFNPNILEEKAFNFYNITRERRNLVENCKNKLDIIKTICEEHKDDKILIISKHGEFANDITKYLNNNGIKCIGYHNELKPVAAFDGNGIPILIKSGEKKGQQKILSHQAQCSANQALFNDGQVNVLSIKLSSNTKLAIACNLVILTSSLLDDISNIKKRFCNVRFTYNPTIIYKVYCTNTIEQDKLNVNNANHYTKIINESEDDIHFDENTGNIIL